MTWIKIVPMNEADERLRRAIEMEQALYPKEYETPVHPTDDGSAGIVASHTLIPDALYHAFATFGALMDAPFLIIYLFVLLLLHPLYLLVVVSGWPGWERLRW